MKKKQPEYTESCDACAYRDGSWCEKLNACVFGWNKQDPAGVFGIDPRCPLEDFKEKHGVQEDNQDQLEMPEAFPI